MTEYIELYSQNEKNFLNYNQNFISMLEQLYELEPYIIKEEKYKEGCLIIDHIEQSCILYNNCIYYNKEIYDKYIYNQFQVKCLETITNNGNINYYYTAIENNNINPTHCFYLNLDCLEKSCFLTDKNSIRMYNSKFRFFNNIKFVNKNNVTLPFSQQSLYTNVYDNIDGCVLVNIDSRNILIFEKHTIFHHNKIKTNCLNKKNKAYVIDDDARNKIKFRYSYANQPEILFLGAFAVKSLSILTYSSFFNVICYIIFIFLIVMCIKIATSIKLSGFVYFLNTMNYYSSINVFYDNVYYKNKPLPNNINDVKYM